MIRKCIYPVISQPVICEGLRDQFAFRPSGSTTSAVISLLSTVTVMLQENTYVRVVALDFSKAFDSVRHSELGRKLSAVPVSDQVYNWILKYIENRYHCTKAGGVFSSPAYINASVVQGSAIEPVYFIINAQDLKASVEGNALLKYADDTYLLVPEKMKTHCVQNYQVYRVGQ